MNNELSPRVMRRLRKVGPVLITCNQQGLDFKTAAKKAKVSIPSAMLYAQLLDIKWTNYKPRGKYHRYAQ
jgi:hypothetical protein